MIRLAWVPKTWLTGLLGACLAVSSVKAVTMEGQAFDDAIRLGNSDLILNGLGMRSVWVFKGYLAGLYLSEKSTTRSSVLQARGAKRLQLRMLHSASSETFIDALVPGIRKNATPMELVRLRDRIAQMERTIYGIGSTEVGDVIDFDYLPEIGTTIAVNGVRKGASIAGVDFYDAVLGIFVGTYPVDESLKRSLLGSP